MKRRQFLESVTAAAMLSVGQTPVFGSVLDTVAARPFSAGPSGSNERDFFYRPKYGWTGDIQPFFKDGKFLLFFSPAWRDISHCPKGEPLYWPGSWYLTSTDDFVHFTEYGRVLPRGGRNEQDFGCFAGSVVEAEGQYHIFYAGNNQYFPKQGRPANGIMHAVSQDLFHWTKIPEDTFYATSSIYDADDWRDPFVFWNEDVHEYWMLVVARVKTGAPRRRGCTALCTSHDLKKWTVQEPFWAPGLYLDHECPDLFRMGDWWYLIFSEYSEQHRTHYRMSRSLKGPWLAPENDSFDGRAFYAAKTAFDGRRRFLFGWSPTRYDKTDYLRWNLDCGFIPCKPYPPGIEIGPSGWDWGGNLVVHELLQEADGSLSVKVPDTVSGAFSKMGEYQFPSGADVKTFEEGVELDALAKLVCFPAGMMPDRCKIEAKVTFAQNTHGCGLMLRASEDLDSAYYVRLEPAQNRLVLDTWPRSGDIPFSVGIERPMSLSPGEPVHLKVFVDGTTCVVYASNKVAMNTRLYDLKRGRWGVFARDGSAKFEKLRIYTQ